MVTQTHQVHSKLREIRQSSLMGDFNGEFNRDLDQHVKDMKSEQFFGETEYQRQRKGTNKADLKRHGPMIIIGRFGRQGEKAL